MKTVGLVVLLLFVSPLSGAIRLVDQNSTPIHDVTVEMLIPSSSQSSAVSPLSIAGISDRQGTVSLEIPQLGDAMLIIDDDDFEPTVVKVYSKSSVQEVRLSRGVTWRGDVISNTAELHLAGEICARGEVLVKTSALNHRWRRCAPVEDGRFVLHGLPRGPIRAEVQIGGFLPVVSTVDPEDKSSIRIQRAIVVRGIVRDSHNHPVVGAVVRAGTARGRTNESGRFLVAASALPAEVQVSARGYRTWTDEIHSIREQEIRLLPAEQLAGVLIDEVGAPIRHATARIEHSYGNGEQRTNWQVLETAADGKFVFDVREPGQYSVILRARGFRDLLLPNIEIPANSTVTLGFLTLRRGCGVTGIVIDGETGKPARGALLDIAPVGALLLQIIGNNTIPASVTDDNGRFAITGLDIGRYVLTIRRNNAATIHRLIDTPREQVEDIGAIWLDHGVEVGGRVLNVDSQPADRIQVRLFDPAHEMIEPFAITVTDTEGRFHFAPIVAGRYRFEVGNERLLLAQEVDIPTSAKKLDLDLRLTTVNISGLVTRNGIPVRGGMIRIVSDVDPAQRRGKIIMNTAQGRLTWGIPQSAIQTEVDSSGSFSTREAPQGLVRIWYAGAVGDTCFRTAILSTNTNIAIELDGHLLRGRLVDATTQSAVSGTVALLNNEGHLLSDTYTTADGAFRFPDLEEGAYRLRAMSSGYKTALTEAIPVSIQSGSQTVELQRGDTAELTVSFARDNGNAIEGIPVTVFDRAGALIKSQPTLSSGSRRFRDLDSGDYFVGWSDSLGGAGFQAVQIKAGDPTAMFMTLSSSAPLVISCSSHRCDGAAVDLLEIESLDHLDVTPLVSGVTPALRMSADGEVSVGRLMAGRYHVRLWVAEQRWESDVTVGSSPTRLNFD